jgi:1,2-diacylglycerol 3-alpha-glucosyltransferase
MIRAAILFHRIGPYHVARVRAAMRYLDVTLIEYVQLDGTYAWDVIKGDAGIRRMTLFPSDEFLGRPPAEVAPRVWQALTEAAPEVVAIPGWGDVCSRLALAWCQKHRIPAVVMIESIKEHYKGSRAWWKEAIKRQFVRLCSAAFVGGRDHARYAVALGVPPRLISDGYDVVDNEHFAQRASAVRGLAPEAKAKYSLPQYFFLASARLVEEKNLSRLVEAYARYCTITPRGENGKPQMQTWDLVILGDGPLRPALESQRSELNLDGHVHLPGFKQYEELPNYYALARAFILPSIYEPWGLVVNEAMASGLPVLVSNHCGCAAELVRENYNGFTFDPRDVGALAQLMLRTSAPDFPLAEFGLASRAIVGSWGPERFAQGLNAAVIRAIAAGPPRPSLLHRLLLRALVFPRCVSRGAGTAGF